jgi:hypothetical protein
MKTVSLKIGNTFNLRVNKKLVDIETADKQWKVQFGAQTKEYAQIMYLLENKDEKALVNLAFLLFDTRLIVADTSFLKFYQNMLKEFIASKEVAPEVSKEEDDKILEEERALHEANEQ